MREPRREFSLSLSRDCLGINIKTDNEIPPSAGLFREGQAVSLQPLGGGRLDHVRTVEPNLLPLQSGHLYDGAAERLPQGDLVGEGQVGAVSAEDRVRFVTNNESDVCRDLAGDSVSLLAEGHLGARFPSRLHVNLENFVLGCDPPVIVMDLPRDLYFFLCTLRDLLQCDGYFFLYGGVLYLRLFTWHPAVRPEVGRSAKLTPHIFVAQTSNKLLNVDVHSLRPVNSSEAAGASHTSGTGGEE